MNPYELQAGGIWVKKEFSKMSSIVKRFSGSLSHPLLYFAMNMGMRKFTKADTRRLPDLVSEIFAA
jgi:hypothetical protein